MKSIQISRNRGYLFRTYHKAGSHEHLHLAATLKAPRGLGNIYSRRKGTSSLIMVKLWLEVIGMGKQEANKLEVEFHIIVLENIFVFLWLVLSCKLGQNIRKLAVID